MLVSKAKFSQLLGLSRTAITIATKPGGHLEGALCGKRIDLDSEVAKAYIRKRGVDPSTIGAKTGPPASPHAQALSNIFAPPISSDELASLPPVAPDIPLEDLERMTLSQLCQVFGTDDRFKVWASARKVITDIRRNDLANAKTAGDLVSRRLVKSSVIDPLDGAFTRLLTDVKRTLAVRIVAMIRAEASQEKVESFITDQLTSVLDPLKEQMKRGIKGV